MTFLPEPHPERIYSVSLVGTAVKYGDHLFVGLKIIDKDQRGLSVVPHARVVFAIGDEGNPEKEVFDCPLDMARALAGRIIEFCDAAEKISK